jgi:hypothetical protein
MVDTWHGRLERYPTDTMIKWMDRRFAPDAIVLSFVADDVNRSGGELLVGRRVAALFS